MNTIKVLGHRGCAGLEPENTIRAFKKAVNLKVDLIEFDVRMTKDKELVVIHDEKVDRETNGKGYVRDFTFEEIRKLNIRKNEKIPSFEEVINLLKKEGPIIVIEIKEPETLKKVLEIVKKEKLKNKVLIISFWQDVIKKIKEIEPEIKTGIIFKKKIAKIIPLMKNAKAEVLCLNYPAVDEKIVEDCHKNNVKLNVWTVNEVKDIERMIRLKVDIIASDYPDRVLAKLKK